MDISTKLPEDFQYVYQFANGESQYRCVAAVLAMIGEFAFPGKWQSPAELMHQIYEHYAGPDIPSNTDGLTKEQCLDWLNTNHVGFIDLQDLIGDANALREELEAQNKQGVVQLITVADESQLRYAKNGEKLHNWVDVGLHHCILRVGFSDSDGYGLYMEPAASLAFPHPVPIMWDDIAKAGVMTILSIMPHGVAVPPAGFRFSQGTWPKPKATFDVAKAESTVSAMAQAAVALQQAAAALISDLDALKEEV